MPMVESYSTRSGESVAAREPLVAHPGTETGLALLLALTVAVVPAADGDGFYVLAGDLEVSLALVELPGGGEVECPF